MSFPWLDINTLISNLGRQTAELEKVRETLLTANIADLKHIYSEEYCSVCRGFCPTKSNTLHHLKILAQRTEAVTVSILDLSHNRLCAQNLFAISNPPIL
jgi:hypothetical protein